MKEKYTDEKWVEVPMDEEIARKLMRLTKKQLIERYCVNTCELHLANKKAVEVQTKLDKAEAYVEQARAMLEAVMERWYEYDT
jgi:hypothetical protein